MATIMCLPDEMMDIILGYSDITIENITNFRCVCKRFKWAAQYNNYWKKKFSQRWLSAKKLYNKEFKENEQEEFEENKQRDKRSSIFVKTGINYARELRNYVSQIIHSHYYESNKDYHPGFHYKTINNCIKFEYIFYLHRHLRNNLREIIYKPENFIKYSFFIDELKNLLTQSPRRTGVDLTERYCHIKLFHFMRQSVVRRKWIRYREQPYRKQLFERIATIMAQWIQPEKDVFYSSVEATLDNIAQDVLKCLREKHPDHSIFSTSAETFSYWKNHNIDDNHWNEVEGTQIMNTLEEYIFGKLNFQPTKSKDEKLEYMCIDYVLKEKKGQEIILLIIYHSVARRLGLRCNIMKIYCPRVNIFCIFWKPKYAMSSFENESSSENERCFSISVKEFSAHIVNRLLMLRTLSSQASSVITARQMWQKLLNIFVDVKYQYNYTCRINPYFEYGWKSFLSLGFKKIEQSNIRPEDVKFAVGMIVKHSDQYTNSSAGVIIGWHRHGDKNVDVVTRNYNDHVEHSVLPLNYYHKINFLRKTYYVILTENNKMCFVEEDAITLTTPKWIENDEIGRYFNKFENTHYVPNAMLARLYPHDVAITVQTTIN